MRDGLCEITHSPGSGKDDYVQQDLKDVKRLLQPAEGDDEPCTKAELKKALSAVVELIEHRSI